MPIGVGYRTHAETLGLPFHLPRSELNRDQGQLGGSRAVKIVADQHRPAEAVRKPALEVNLFCGDSAAVRFQTNESASDTKRPAVHIGATRDRRESLRRALDHFLVAPEEGARLRINSDDALAQKLHVLFAPAPLHDDRRRITRGIAARNRRFPDDRARLFVERHDRGLRAAGGYDNDGAVHQRRLCIGPFVRLAAELFTEVLLPSNLAALGFDAGEIAVRAQRVDEISVNAWSGPGFRERRVLIRVADVTEARCPDRFSILS